MLTLLRNTSRLDTLMCVWEVNPVWLQSIGKSLSITRKYREWMWNSQQLPLLLSFSCLNCECHKHFHVCDPVLCLCLIKVSRTFRCSVGAKRTALTSVCWENFLPTLMLQNLSLLLELKASPALNLSANVLPGFRSSLR